MTEYVTSLCEAKSIMGNDNVVSKIDLDSLNLYADHGSLKIHRKLLEWDKKEIVLRRKEILPQDVMSYIINYNVKSIYYPKHSSLGFPDRKPYRFWKKKWLKKDKVDAWFHFRHCDEYKKVWVTYEEEIEAECPYMLIPGVRMNIIDMFHRFEGNICYQNDPMKSDCRADIEEMHNNYKRTLERNIEEGWYLILKHPERKRFIKKDRYEQKYALREHEEWGKTAETIWAIIASKLILEKDIIKDYTCCNDWIYPNEGPFTTMVRNVVAYDDMNRGNIFLTHNNDFHSHRNTVISVLSKVSA